MNPPASWLTLQSIFSALTLIFGVVSVGVVDLALLIVLIDGLLAIHADDGGIGIAVHFVHTVHVAVHGAVHLTIHVHGGITVHFHVAEGGS